MKRVAILHYAGPPVVGGVESTIYHHARLLAAMGYDVRVIAGRGQPFHPAVAFHQVPEIDSRHPEVLAVGQALAQGQVIKAFEQVRERLTGQLEELLTDVDVLIVHNAITLHKNLPLTAALHQLAQARVAALLAWCHDFAWLDELYTPDLHPGYPWDLLRNAWPNTVYVVVSNHRRQQLARLLGLPTEAVRVVTPGVDVAEFYKLEPRTRELVQQLNLLAAEPLLLLPARVTRRKNIEFAIRVTAALSQHCPRATLVVTGPPGPHNPSNVAYLERLCRLRQELGVVKQVHFLYEYGKGDQPLHLDDAMVADFYRLADLLLFPSFREGFGIPVLEAGLARLPVFAADIPSVRESAGDLAIRFDPEGDPVAVAAAIRNRLSDSAAYRLRRRVLQRFTWQAIVAQQVVPLLEEVSNHGQTKATQISAR